MTKATEDPMLVEGNCVAVSFDGGETWTEFRTRNHLERALECIDRQLGRTDAVTYMTGEAS